MSRLYRERLLRSTTQVDEINVFRVTSKDKQGNVHAKNESEARQKAKARGMKGDIKVTDMGVYKGQPTLGTRREETVNAPPQGGVSGAKTPAEKRREREKAKVVGRHHADTAKGERAKIQGKSFADIAARARRKALGLSELEIDEGTKEEYQKFFNAAMKKFKIDSPSDLKSDEEKKKFYDYVDKNYKGEKNEDIKLRSLESTVADVVMGTTT